MKKIIALLLAALMVLSLCACAAEEDTSRKKKDKEEQVNAYEEYEELLKYLEEEDYQAALYYIQELYDEQQANLADVPADAEQQYQHLMWALECYEDDSNMWVDELDDSLGGSDLAKYIYDILVQLGDYKDCKELLARFSTVESVLLKTEVVNVDNLGNQNNYSSKRIYNTDGLLVELENPLDVEKNSHLFGQNFWGDYMFSYDNSGFLSSIECGYFYSDSKDVNAVIRYHYDEKGLPVKLETDTADGTSYISEYTYDEQGRVAKITASGGYYSYVTEYTYNEEGVLVKEVREEFYSNDMDLINRTTFEYTLGEDGRATGYTELIQSSYSSYSKSFYRTQTNTHALTMDENGRILTDNVTFGMNIDREGNETKPDYVSGVYTYTYGDYFIFE